MSLLDRVRSALAPEYEVESELASGGMGIVFAAREPALERWVAIKVLKPELATATAADRFQREARILARVRHGSIVPIHRVGEADGFFYFVMEYLDGGTLADRLQQGPLGPRDAVRLGIDLLDALDQAHREGILHRDLKPSNIFFRDRQPMLGDFGIAKSTTAGDAPLTQAGRVVGTPAYMAPEQERGETVTVATDIYAFGMLLYESVTGCRWSTAKEVADPDRFSGVPRGLARVLRCALEPDPGQRWPSAGAFRMALRRSRGIRNPWPAAAAVSGMAVIGALAIVLGSPPRPAADVTDLAILPFAVEGSDAVADLGYALARTTADHLEADVSNSGLSLTPMSFTLPWGAGVNTGEPLRPDALAELRTRHVARGFVTVEGDTIAVRVEVTDGQGVVRQTARLASSAENPYHLGYRIGHAVVRILAPDRAATYRGSQSLSGRSGAVIAAYTRGEAAFQRELWAVAERQYLDALELDSTFALAWWGLYNARRWLRDPYQFELADVFARYGDQFNDLDRLLIEADLAGTARERLAHYRQAIAHSPHDGSPWLLYGNDAFHRGALAGYELDTAVAAFDSAIAHNRFLAPAYSASAWALIRLGDGDRAAAMMRRYAEVAAPDETAPGFRLGSFLDLAWTMRFEADRADTRLNEVLGSASGTAGILDQLRWAPSIGVPGALYTLGGRLAAALPDPDMRASALVAQGLGLIALGRVRAGTAHFDSAAVSVPLPELALQAAQWRVIPGVVGMPGNGADDIEIGLAALERLTTDPGVGVRAAWTITLAHVHSTGVVPTSWTERVAGNPPVPVGLGATIDAMLSAREGNWRGAIERLRPVLDLDIGGRGGDPFVRSVAHLLGARWFDRLGDADAADLSRRWYLNADAVGWLVGPQQASEVDWAFEAFARYGRGTSLAGDRNPSLACEVLPEVASRWANAESAFGELRQRVSAALDRCVGSER